MLLDDNFATIVAAVKAGRRIYDNIQKFIKYILTGNTGEIVVMLTGPILGMPLPLLPIQILWINLVSRTFPLQWEELSVCAAGAVAIIFVTEFKKLFLCKKQNFITS